MFHVKHLDALAAKMFPGAIVIYPSHGYATMLYQNRNMTAGNCKQPLPARRPPPLLPDPLLVTIGDPTKEER